MKAFQTIARSRAMISKFNASAVWKLASEAAILLGSCAAAAVPAHAVQLRVPADYPTISAAVTAAVNGDTVLVADGTYAASTNGNIITSKIISVESANGAASTIIDCIGGSYFAVIGASTTVRGFTFRNCTNSGGVITTQGYNTVKDCLFINNDNESAAGSAINVTTGYATIDGCIFTGNTGLGAINFNHGSGQLFNCAFTNNKGNFAGGGGINANMASVNVTDSTFTGNSSSAQGRGGAINWLNGQMTLNRCGFFKNTSILGGGAVCLSGVFDSRFNATACIFQNNTAPKGGALFTDSSQGTNTVTAENCQFIGNRAANSGNSVTNEGAAIYTLSPPRIWTLYYINNCSFFGNDVTPRTTGAGTISGGAGATLNLLNTIMYGDLSPAEVSTANPMAQVNVTASDINQANLGSIDADPLYADPAAGDLHIPFSSPAAHTGASGGPAIDFDGNTRPSPPSIGAFEPSIIADHFSVSAPGNATAGVAFYVNVAAVGQSGNVVKGYRGTVHVTSTDPLAVLPADFVLAGGAKQISIKLRSPGIHTLTLTDTASPALTGTSGGVNVTVIPTKFVISGPATTVAGSPVLFTITAKDDVGNIAAEYSGKARFQTTDPLATVPADTTITNGKGTCIILFKTSGTWKVSASDTANAAIKGLTAITVKD